MDVAGAEVLIAPPQGLIGAKVFTPIEALPHCFRRDDAERVAAAPKARDTWNRQRALFSWMASLNFREIELVRPSPARGAALE